MKIAHLVLTFTLFYFSPFLAHFNAENSCIAFFLSTFISPKLQCLFAFFFFFFPFHCFWKHILLSHNIPQPWFHLPIWLFHSYERIVLEYLENSHCSALKDFYPLLKCVWEWVDSEIKRREVCQLSGDGYLFLSVLGNIFSPYSHERVLNISLYPITGS